MDTVPMSLKAHLMYEKKYKTKNQIFYPNFLNNLKRKCKIKDC